MLMLNGGRSFLSITERRDCVLKSGDISVHNVEHDLSELFLADPLR